jgi:hypothetical protein
MKTQKRNAVAICTLIVLLCLLGACATMQARSVKTTGFLGDYSKLKPGKEGQALLVYIDPEADIRFYNRIIMDPVKLYASSQNSMSNVSNEERQKLLNYADAAIREQLAKDYVFVREPGASAMRLRVAITEAQDANVTMDTISTVLPIGLALAGLQAVATGSCAFVGSAGIEAELLDSQTGKRLMAAVDRRTGGKMTGQGDKFDEWRTVKNAIDFWAQRLQERLTELRGEKKMP